MNPLVALTPAVVGHVPAWVEATRVLAHQGGWDEILMVLVPVSVFAALLYVANQRAARLAARGSDPAATAEPAADTDPATGAAAPRNDRGGPI